MLKTVKVKKKLRLDEVVKYIFDNDIEDENYTTSETEHFGQGKVRASVYGDITLSGYIKKDTTFIVEMEEEITKDTKFEWLVESSNVRVWNEKNASIRDVLREDTKQIRALINGKLELIHEGNENV